MKTEEEKDEQLSQWLEGKLSGQELSAFEARSDFKDYNSIIADVEDLTYPRMDEDAVFSKIQDAIAANSSSSKTANVIPLRRLILAVASIAILSFAVLTLIPGSTEITSDAGQLVAHTLPDDSEIKLNENSHIKYKDNFRNDRVLQLDGEAFFKVKKGKSFKVETKNGVVSVLGTSFNVFARNEIFVVSCKTGKVKVDSKTDSYILEKGERVKLENGNTKGKNTIDIYKIGIWASNESYFSSARLEEVLLALSSIYDVDINIPATLKERKFTGSFVHDDLKKALKMVLSPMKITYTVDDQGKIDLGE